MNKEQEINKVNNLPFDPETRNKVIAQINFRQATLDTPNTTIFQELEDLLKSKDLYNDNWLTPIYISPDIYWALYMPKNLKELKDTFYPHDIDLLYMDNYTNVAYLQILEFRRETHSQYELLAQDGNLKIWGPQINWIV